MACATTPGGRAGSITPSSSRRTTYRRPPSASGSEAVRKASSTSVRPRPGIAPAAACRCNRRTRRARSTSHSLAQEGGEVARLGVHEAGARPDVQRDVRNQRLRNAGAGLARDQILDDAVGDDLRLLVEE